jgi:hypothetical protein
VAQLAFEPRSGSTPVAARSCSTDAASDTSTLVRARGDDLLYVTTQGDLVVINTPSGELADLSASVARVPGDFYDARWSS